MKDILTGLFTALIALLAAFAPIYAYAAAYLGEWAHVAPAVAVAILSCVHLNRATREA